MREKRLYQTLVERIARLIEEGAYPPGSRLPGERELAEQFKVSRVTVREAEIALQALGLIDIRTGSGVYVLEAGGQGYGRLPNVTALELTEARLLFESEVAALAALAIDDQTLEELTGYIAQMTDADSCDEKAAELADRNFHVVIAAASGNTALRYIVETLWKMRTELAQVKEVYDSVCLGDATARGSEHVEILDALKARDPTAARAAMRKHFTRLLESMLDVTEERAFEELLKQTTESRRRFLKSIQI